MFRLLIVPVFATLLVLSSAALAQEKGAIIDKSKMPAAAGDAKDFVPSGWIIEQQVSGDLNADSLPDLAVKLIQAKPAGGVEEEPENSRQRVLLILLQDKDGQLRRAAVAEKLLLCPACGGALYGVLEAPANLKIERGVIIVNQNYGSRETTEQTFRFRYDSAVQKFVLIGFDVTNNDRATGAVIKDSTNFSTGKKISSSWQLNSSGNKGPVKNISQTVAKTQVAMEDVDSEKF